MRPPQRRDRPHVFAHSRGASGGLAGGRTGSLHQKRKGGRGPADGTSRSAEPRSTKTRCPPPHRARPFPTGLQSRMREAGEASPLAVREAATRGEAQLLGGCPGCFSICSPAVRGALCASDKRPQSRGRADTACHAALQEAATPTRSPGLDSCFGVAAVRWRFTEEVRRGGGPACRLRPELYRQAPVAGCRRGGRQTGPRPLRGSPAHGQHRTWAPNVQPAR